MKKTILITACNLYPNDGGDKITTWGLLNKLNEFSDIYLLNILDERDYTIDEIKNLKTLCKGLTLFRDRFSSSIISFIFSYLYRKPYMVVRRSNRKLITQAVFTEIQRIKPDNIIWDHVRTTSYFSQNDYFNIIFEHNYEAGIYAEKILLYPKIIRGILSWQVKFTDKYNLYIDKLMQKVVYVSASDAAHYNLPQAAVWQYKNIIFSHELNKVKETKLINLLFVGSLEWYPNVEGIIWFIENVMPLLNDNFKLTIVGKNPAEKLKEKIAGNTRINAFYNVPSVESYYLEADVFVSPIFLGLGVNVKITEAASYHIPIVASSHSLKGYNSLSFLPIADSPNDFAEGIMKLKSIANREQQSKLIGEWHKEYLDKADSLFSSLYNLS